jgi:hypothetical protein
METGSAIKVLGTDVNDEACNWQTLKQNGCDFGMVKVCQGDYLPNAKFPVHLAGMVAAGTSYRAGYLWDDPNVAPKAQVDKFESFLTPAVQFAVNDIEQFWKSWTEWAQHKITHFFDKTMLADHYQETTELLAKLLPVMPYTRLSFVREYAPAMLLWMEQFPLCLAVYTAIGGQLTWAQVVAACPDPSTYPAYYLPPSGNDPAVWQFTGDEVIVPGKEGAIDLLVAWQSTMDAVARITIPPPG